jgi:predicted phosphate transport protein (TIGR00153 family)
MLAEKLLIWLTKKGGINALKILSDHLAKVNEATLEFKELLENISEGKDKEANENMGKIFLIEEGCDHLARNIAIELQKGKLPPIDREDTLQLLWKHEKIIGLIKDATLILKIIELDAKGKTPKELLKSYANLVENMINELKAYSLSINKIATNVNEAYKLKLEVERIEHLIDEEYFRVRRELHFKYGNQIETPLFIFLKDLLDTIERISDIIEDSGDLIQVIMARVSAMLFGSE